MSVCCGVVAFASGSSRVQSPTECGVSEYDREALMIRRLLPTSGGCYTVGGGEQNT